MYNMTIFGKVEFFLDQQPYRKSAIFKIEDYGGKAHLWDFAPKIVLKPIYPAKTSNRNLELELKFLRDFMPGPGL